MSVKVKVKGDYSKTYSFLKRCGRDLSDAYLNKWGAMGVMALRDATPQDTGLTGASWYYRIIRRRDSISIEWNNSNVVDGVPIALIIQYGHATKSGGYISGIDYINPALRPIFKQIEDEVWKEVRSK